LGFDYLLIVELAYLNIYPKNTFGMKKNVDSKFAPKRQNQGDGDLSSFVCENKYNEIM
jgi:hypothetical protein